MLEKFDSRLLRRDRPATERPTVVVDTVAEDYERGYTDRNGVSYKFHKNGGAARYYASTAVSKDFCRKCSKTVWGGERVMMRMAFGVSEYIHEHCYEEQAR